jgi:hydrogenase maturation protease
MDGYDATVLIDAAPRGEKPGTVYLIELDADKVEICEGEIADAHSLTPVRVLQLIRALGGNAKNLYIIGCEPARLDGEGVIGLSEAVRNAIPLAVEMIEKVLADFSSGRKIPKIFPNHSNGHMRNF